MPTLVVRNVDVTVSGTLPPPSSLLYNLPDFGWDLAGPSHYHTSAHSLNCICEPSFVNIILVVLVSIGCQECSDARGRFCSVRHCLRLSAQILCQFVSSAHGNEREGHHQIFSPASLGGTIQRRHGLGPSNSNFIPTGSLGRGSHALSLALVHIPLPDVNDVAVESYVRIR